MKGVDSVNLSSCPKCHEKIEENMKRCPKCKAKMKFNKKRKKLPILLIAVIIITFVIGIGIYSGISIVNENKRKAQEEAEKKYYDSLPIKVNISMTSNRGTVSFILYELELNPALVTMGANCYTGVQKNEFKTEKYGILHTEFRYCKSSSSIAFRVYNDEDEQPLREPKDGELLKFDKYGNPIITNNKS
mgnify:CR=1 FL=1